MTSSDPSMALGEAWWSITVVVPERRASMPPTRAEARIDSSSRARSRRHHTRWRICRKLAGGASEYGIPLARDEYRWVWAQTLPGTIRHPEQSRRGPPDGTEPTATTRL